MRRLFSIALLGALAACAPETGDAKYAEVVEVPPPGQAPTTTVAAPPAPAATPAAPQTATADGAEPGATKTESFPLQVPTSATVTDVSSVRRVGRRGRKGRIVQMSLQTPQTPGEVATFYQQELKRHGLLAKTKSSKFGDGTASTLQARKKRLRVKIVATRNRPSEPTEVILTWNRS